MTDRTAHTQCTYCGVYFQGSHVCKYMEVQVLPPAVQVTPPVAVDWVKSPPHYNQGGIETIDAIREALGSEGFNAYCIGNVMKYCWRHKHKGGQQDLQKAVWYMRFANGDDPRKS